MNISQMNKSIGNGNKHFACAISTYKDLRSESEYIVDIFDTAIKELTNSKVKPRYYVFYFINGNVKLNKFDERSRKKAENLILNQELKALALHFSEEEYNKNYIIQNEISVQVIICSKQLDEIDSNFKFNKNEVAFSVTTKCNYDKLEFLVKWVKNIFVKVDGINGYLDCLPSKNLCGFVAPTAYEDITTQNATYFGDYVNKLRGYFWLSILTEKHIENLGGEDYVKNNIPGYEITEIQMKDGSKTLFCQLTNNILKFDKQEYKKLREFLNPLLDKENMRYEAIYYKERNSIDDRRLVLSENLDSELNVFKRRDTTELIKEVAEKMKKELESKKNG